MNVQSPHDPDSEDAGADLVSQAEAARHAGRVLARLPEADRNRGLHEAARALRASARVILEANARDVAAFTGSAAMRDRLVLTDTRVEAMAAGLEQVASLPDPVGRVLAEWTRPNGLVIRRVTQPLGVIGMVYESRPNVGADAAGLTLKSGNALLLRGGSESFFSAAAISAAIAAGLRAAGLPERAVQSAPTSDRAYVAAMLAASGKIDLMIPRGGRSLVERVEREARIPVLSHASGLCHTYVHAAADPEMAIAIVANAKMRRTGICGATETLLIDTAIAPGLLPRIVDHLAGLGCECRGDARARAAAPSLAANPAPDFDVEHLDAILSVAVVDGVEAALAHIARHGTGHTEAIVTSDEAAARIFLDGTESAVAMWNASTQFCDGGEFGFGAEIGIATGRLHARGPVGLEQLVTWRYQVVGHGQLRP